MFPASILQGTGAERVATVTCDHLLSLIETQGQRLASNSCVAKDGIKPGTRLPCKAFLNWPKPEDLKQLVREGTSPVAMVGEGRNLESPTPPWGAGFQTKMMEGKAAFSRDPSHGSYIRRKSKTLEGGGSHEGCRGGRTAKRRGERGPTAPPGGIPGQRSGGTSGNLEGLDETGEAGAWWVTTGHREGREMAHSWH